MKKFKNIFKTMVSLENLFMAWDAFRAGKTNKPDVQRFYYNLETNVFSLHEELKSEHYQHGVYSSFHITDPKPRRIHKASVRDRLVHHAVFRILNYIFEPTFISQSFSGRRSKGSHLGIDFLDLALRKINKNNFSPCFALKCDIKKFFASVDHEILKKIIFKKIADEKALRLIRGVIDSFSIADGQGGGVKLKVCR